LGGGAGPWVFLCKLKNNKKHGKIKQIAKTYDGSANYFWHFGIVWPETIFLPVSLGFSY